MINRILFQRCIFWNIEKLDSLTHVKYLNIYRGRTNVNIFHIIPYSLIISPLKRRLKIVDYKLLGFFWCLTVVGVHKVTDKIIWKNCYIIRKLKAKLNLVLKLRPW